VESPEILVICLNNQELPGENSTNLKEKNKMLTQLCIPDNSCKGNNSQHLQYELRIGIIRNLKLDTVSTYLFNKEKSFIINEDYSVDEIRLPENFEPEFLIYWGTETCK